MDLPDHLEQPLVRNPTGRPLAARSPVVRGRRHAQGLADRLDPEAVTLLVDEGAHLGRCGSSSPAKNRLAAFKISFVRRSSSHLTPQLADLLTLLRAQQIRPRALVRLDLPHVLPQRLGRQPRSAATCAIGRPDSTPAASPAPTAPPGTSLTSPSPTPSSRAHALPSKSPSNPTARAPEERSSI